MIIGQYYQFVRLGFEGYKKIMASLLNVAQRLQEGIEKLGMPLLMLRHILIRPTCSEVSINEPQFTALLPHKLSRIKQQDNGDSLPCLTLVLQAVPFHGGHILLDTGACQLRVILHLSRRPFRDLQQAQDAAACSFWP